MPTDLQDQKETPTRAEENFVRSRVTENSESPRGRMLPHSPGDQHCPSAVLGKTWAVLRRMDSPPPLTSVVLRKDRLPPNHLCGPRRDGRPPPPTHPADPTRRTGG